MNAAGKFKQNSREQNSPNLSPVDALNFFLSNNLRFVLSIPPPTEGRQFFDQLIRFTASNFTKEREAERDAAAASFVHQLFEAEDSAFSPCSIAARCSEIGKK